GFVAAWDVESSVRDAILRHPAEPSCCRETCCPLLFGRTAIVPPTQLPAFTVDAASVKPTAAWTTPFLAVEASCSHVIPTASTTARYDAFRCGANEKVKPPALPEVLDARTVQVAAPAGFCSRSTVRPAAQGESACTT